MGIGHVRVHQHRPIRGQVKTITAKREADCWYVVLSCDDVPAEPWSRHRQRQRQALKAPDGK